MKRETVLKMLTKRLAESKRSINTSYQFEDLVDVLGGDNSKEPQHRINMKKDIEQLEFLISALKDTNTKPCNQELWAHCSHWKIQMAGCLGCNKPFERFPTGKLTPPTQ